MRVLLNSIALDQNRWTKEKIPANDLRTAILPRIASSIFEHVEIWQYHVSSKTPEEIQEIAEEAKSMGLDFPVFGAYPKFHFEGEEGESEQKKLLRLLDYAEAFGSKLVKFFFGGVKGSAITDQQLELTTQRVTEWIEYGQSKGLSFCAELHGGTLFDPYESGKQFLKNHPELELKICFQPYDFNDTDACVRLIEDCGESIVHAHFQGRDADGFCRLEEASVDYKKIIPALAKANPDFIPSIEFVKGGFPGGGEPLDFDRAIADAEADAKFIESQL